ncbi:MAG: dimethylmenaquinone methyltransferase [Thermoproteota archaeon]|nr:MAG: dimethylmenaquinone methyltransferase [Candidatus Korarchaeota archaeon]
MERDMKPLALLTYLLLALLLYILVLARVLRRFFKMPCPHQAAYLIENPVRKVFFGPEKILKRAGVLPGMKVLELGPGGGFLTVEAAKMVGEEGEVHCIDIQPEMIKILMKKVKKMGLCEKVNAIVGDAANLPYLSGSFDLVFMVAVLGEIFDQKGAINEIRRVLREGGILSITEILLDPDYALARTVRRLCTESGFEHLDTKGNVFCYTANFIKKGF